MQIRKPRSEIKNDAVAELDARIKHAHETGDIEDAREVKGILKGLELARLFHGAEAMAEFRQLQRSVGKLFPST